MDNIETKYPVILPIVKEFERFIKGVKHRIDHNWDYRQTNRTKGQDLVEWRKLEGRVTGAQDMLPESEKELHDYINNLCESNAHIHQRLHRQVIHNRP